MGIFQYGIISKTTLLSSNSASDIVDINTLFYAVVALAVLLLIMLITYFTSIKPNLKGNSSDQNRAYNTAANHTAAQSLNNEQENLVNDSELVAVITAAIYASMGGEVPADGLVVRSIRKVNSKKWINA